MSEPKLNIKEETSAKKTRSPPKKTRVEQSVPKKKKLKTDADKAAEKAQHLRFGKAELTPDELRRLSKAQKREMYAAHAARSAVHREVDQYEDALGTYLVKLSSRELNHADSQSVNTLLHTISDFERISDHSLNIGETAQELYTKQIVFSPAGSRELHVMLSAVTRILELTISAFLNNDVDAAYRVEPLEELIDNLCDEMKLHHIDRLQTGECTLNHGFAFNDLLTNCERVSDHCSNIAVAMIELESESFDTHEYINSVMAMHSHSFDKYYAEYSKEFRI